MADRFYSCAKGDKLPVHVTEGASTSSEAVELRISDSVYTSKMQVIEAIDAIRMYILTKETNPIA